MGPDLPFWCCAPDRETKKGRAPKSRVGGTADYRFIIGQNRGGGVHRLCFFLRIPTGSDTDQRTCRDLSSVYSDHDTAGCRSNTINDTNAAHIRRDAVAARVDRLQSQGIKAVRSCTGRLERAIPNEAPILAGFED